MTANPAEFSAILNASAVAVLHDIAALRASGPDATRWLNGMVTNSVQALAPGEGAYCFLLNAQGRIQGDCTVYREPERPEDSQTAAYWIVTTREQIETIHTLLDKFIIMDDVVLEPLENFSQTLLLLGPQSPEILRSLTLPEFGSLAPFAARSSLHMSFVRQEPPNQSSLNRPGFEGDGLQPVRKTSANQGALAPEGTSEPSDRSSSENQAILTPFIPAQGVPRFELALPNTAHLLEQAKQAGAVEVSPETLEALRIFEARPQYGVDIRDRDLPQETNQQQALHFNKGCYLGQEIVERIRSRGQVHRVFTQFELLSAPNLSSFAAPNLSSFAEGGGPASPREFPAPLTTGSATPPKPVGELTSAALIPLPEGPKLLALGYVRREALDLKQDLLYDGGTAVPRA